MEEVNCFTWEEVCQRWQSQPVDEDQWAEMTKEMLGKKSRNHTRRIKTRNECPFSRASKMSGAGKRHTR
jgi:hypothetical protein